MHHQVPGPKAPQWMRERAERMDHYRQSYWAEGLDAAPAADPQEPRTNLAPPPLPAGNKGTRYTRDDPSLPPDLKENKDLRMVGTVAAGFAPWRHQLVVRGRPIVVSPFAAQSSCNLDMQ